MISVPLVALKIVAAIAATASGGLGIFGDTRDKETGRPNRLGWTLLAVLTVTSLSSLTADLKSSSDADVAQARAAYTAARYAGWAAEPMERARIGIILKVPDNRETQNWLWTNRGLLVGSALNREPGITVDFRR